MQRELRDMLERKVAMGGNYFDMAGNMGGDFIDLGDFAGGDLMAGRRRRRRRVRRGGKKPAHMVKGSQAAKRHMAEVRKGKKFGRGGDFVDLDDYQGGAKKRYKYAKTGNTRNPIEALQRQMYKEQKNKEWLARDGAEYASKLLKKAELITNSLNEMNITPLARAYQGVYDRTMQDYAAYAPAVKAARKQGIKFASPQYQYQAPAYNNAPADLAAYRALYDGVNFNPRMVTPAQLAAAQQAAIAAHAAQVVGPGVHQ